MSAVDAVVERRSAIHAVLWLPIGYAAFIAAHSLVVGIDQALSVMSSNDGVDGMRASNYGDQGLAKIDEDSKGRWHPCSHRLPIPCIFPGTIMVNVSPPSYYCVKHFQQDLGD